MCSNEELQKQIEAVKKETNQNCKTLGEHGKKLDLLAKSNSDIESKIDEIGPYIKKLESDTNKANAYQIVADDLKSKGVTWRFWLTLVSITLGIIATIILLGEKLNLMK